MNKLLLPLLSAALLLAACDGGSTPPGTDTTPPTVTLNAAQSGTSVNLSAAATDNVAVTRVEFYRGSTLVNTDSAAPYTFADAVSAANNGNVNYTAKAYDAAGNVGQASKTVAVSVTVPPAQTLYQGVWGWGIGNPLTGDIIDSGGVVFTEEVVSQGRPAAAGLYLNQAELNGQDGGRSGVAVLGPISAANRLETAFSLTTSNDNRLYFIGTDSNNRLELYEGKPSFDGPGALVTANNQPGQDILVVLVQVSDTVPSSEKALDIMKATGKMLAAKALDAQNLGAAVQTHAARGAQNSNLLRAAQQSLLFSR